MRMTASWSSPQSRNSPNTRLWGDVRLTDRRFPSGRRAYPATVNRRSPDQVSVTPCSPPSRTLRAAPGGGPKGPSLTASARGVIGPGQVGTEKRPSGRTKKLTKPKKGGEDTEYNTEVLDNGPHTRVGKGALFARRAHQRLGRGGHAEPVIGPAEGRTRWLCPPYDCRSPCAAFSVPFPTLILSPRSRPGRRRRANRARGSLP
jgi:hypothetical protein